MTTSALHLGTLHAIRMIRNVNNAGFADRFVKAGPAAAGLELGVALEEGVPADSAIIGAHFLRSFKGAGKGPFGPLVAGNVVYFRREYFLPLIVRQVYLGRIGVGIGGVICFVVTHSSLGVIHRGGTPAHEEQR
jgi:hypothetical protein